MSHHPRFRPLAGFLVCALAMILPCRGQISQDSRELPSPPNPPPLQGPPPEARAMAALSRHTFFPPTPPIFGGRVADSPASLTVNGVRVITPEQLADYVGEPFYPPLGTRLVRSSLDKQAAAHLASYRGKRDALVNDLQNQLAVTANAEPAARESALREFAKIQTPKITALETEAGQLDEELIRGGGSSGVDWNEQRGWKLGSTTGSSAVPPAFAGNAEFQVLRAAAFFQKGLAPEQRGLLREWAMELRGPSGLARLAALAAGGAPARQPLTIFFSPETARLTLPATLPAELRAKIGTYVHNKDELKQELRDAVVAQDKASASKRAAALHDLREKQWPRFVALDELAEAIRRDFAALPPPPPPALPPQLPPELADRITAYKNDREAFIRERNEHQRAAVMAPAVTFPTDATREAIEDKLRTGMNSHMLRLRQSDDDFLAANAERNEALKAARQAILADLDTAAQSMTDPATGEPMTRAKLQRLIDVSDQLFEKIGREDVIYRDYRIAMLEPGLSAEQRRLLFASALAGLAQPLPSGERMPGERFSPAW